MIIIVCIKILGIFFVAFPTADIVGGAMFCITVPIYSFKLFPISVMAFRVNSALLLALLIAFLDFLPFFGTGTALIPWAVVKLSGGDYKYAFGLVLIYLISQLVRQLIQPKIVGDSMGVNPLLTRSPLEDVGT